MQILLACAKTMTDTTDVRVPALSTPRYLEDAMLLANEMRLRSVSEIADMMKCSTKIAREVLLRYQRFTEPSAVVPAVMGYTGQAYRYLKAHTMSHRQLEWTQRHLLITSFLYGLLRPLDGIHPYRMEGNVELECTDFRQVFDYWKPRLTDWLISTVLADDGVLLHLATTEMERLFHWQRVREKVRIVQPKFMVRTPNGMRTMAVYAKSARGAMARHIIDSEAESTTTLPLWDGIGFAYSAADSTEDAPCFILEHG